MLKKIRKMLKQQEGFTLVELMIVVVILGILSGIGIQQYTAVQKRAERNAHNANVRIIESAVRMYEMVKGEKPKDIDNLIPEYLAEVPKHPETGEKYTLDTEGEVAPGYDNGEESGTDG